MISRQGFLQILSEHSLPEEVVQQAFVKAAAGAKTLKVDKCRSALQQTACMNLGVQMPKSKWDKIFLVVLKGVKEVNVDQWVACRKHLCRIVRLAKHEKL